MWRLWVEVTDSSTHKAELLRLSLDIVAVRCRVRVIDGYSCYPKPTARWVDWPQDADKLPSLSARDPRPLSTLVSAGVAPDGLNQPAFRGLQTASSPRPRTSARY